jgi:hypothetical protein
LRRIIEGDGGEDGNAGTGWDILGKKHEQIAAQIPSGDQLDAMSPALIRVHLIDKKIGHTPMVHDGSRIDAMHL